MPRRRRRSGRAAQRRRTQLLRGRGHPHLRVQGPGSTRLSARSDSLAAVGDRGADPAAGTGGHGRAGFRRRRGRAGSRLRLRHRRRRRVGEILLRRGTGRHGPRRRIVGDADPTRRFASGAADTAAQSHVVGHRGARDRPDHRDRARRRTIHPHNRNRHDPGELSRHWPHPLPNAWCGTEWAPRSSSDWPRSRARSPNCPAPTMRSKGCARSSNAAHRSSTANDHDNRRPGAHRRQRGGAHRHPQPAGEAQRDRHSIAHCAGRGDRIRRR